MVRDSSGFARTAPALAVLYLAALSVILLYPFDFALHPGERENSTAWLDDGKGARFGQSGMLVSAGPPAQLYRRLVSGSGLTIELWLSAAASDQQGPARVVSYSINPWERNFTLGQLGNGLNMRLRTTGTDANGAPSVNFADVFVAGRMQHIVVTYDFVEERLYVDGERRASSAPPRGDFATWDPSFYLIFGNELSGGRPWDGSIAYAAIYDRPLPGQVVAVRYKAGDRSIDAPAPAGLVAAFDFAHGLNGPANGKSTAGTTSFAPRLTKPAYVGESHLFLSFIDGKLVFAESTAWDLMRNVILFVPFGVFVFAALEKRAGSAASATSLTVIGASLASATFEALQYFVDARTSSIFDLGTNAVGALVGVLGYRYWLRHGTMR